MSSSDENTISGSFAGDVNTQPTLTGDTYGGAQTLSSGQFDDSNLQRASHNAAVNQIVSDILRLQNSSRISAGVQLPYNIPPHLQAQVIELLKQTTSQSFTTDTNQNSSGSQRSTLNAEPLSTASHPLHTIKESSSEPPITNAYTNQIYVPLLS